jgi:hypothetical protein
MVAAVANCCRVTIYRRFKSRRAYSIAWSKCFLGGVMSTNADRYRALEAECIRHAERALDDAMKRRLEGLAKQWHELAERAEPRRPTTNPDG